MSLPAFHYLISGIGVGVALFTALLISTNNRPLGMSQKLLAALLVLCALNILHPFLPLIFASEAIFGGVRVNEPLQFLVTPLIYLYLKSLLNPGFRLGPLVLIHALPSLSIVVLTLVSFAQSIESALSFPLFTITAWGGLLIQAIFYFSRALSMLHRYRRQLKDRVSNFSGVDVVWIHWFFIVFLLLYASYAVLLALMIHSPTFPPVRAYLSTAITLAVCVLAFRALRQKDVDPPIPQDLAKSRVPEALIAQLKERLRQAMDVERLFLDPELSLSDLANKIDTQRNHVSFVINQSFGQNFYDFVNQKRVEEVIRRMKDPRFRQEKILSLAFDSGFNSKQTFNMVFKKFVSQTPSEYRRAIETGKEKEV